MIVGANFHGLNTPQLIDTVELTIPQVGLRVLGEQMLTGRWLDKAVVAGWRSRWLVTADAEYAWKIKRIDVKDPVSGQVVQTEFVAWNQQWVEAPLGQSVELQSTFSVTDLPVLSDQTYQRCNFSQESPADDGQGGFTGVRLFPGDDTPKTFTRCNLMNCMPPPGSTLTKCLTVIKESDVLISSEDIVIDGQTIGQIEERGSRAHGKVNEQTLEVDMFPQPLETIGRPR